MRTSEAVISSLHDFVRACLEETGVPGLALALTDRTELTHAATFGWANMDARLPVTTETLFEIGSIGKTFTSVLVQQLREDGRLHLHVPVTDHIPWFQVRSRFGPITLHHLLSHTAGIIRGADITSDSLFDVWALRDTETGTPPGEFFHYSNVGYRVIGALIEAVTGRSYPNLLQERILDPLGMASTTPAITNDVRARLAVGYQPFFDDRPFSPGDRLAPAPWLETGTADGSLASTAEDLAAFLRMLLNRGEGARGRLISDESFGLMTQRVAPADEDRDYDCGYGVTLWEANGHPALGHGGSMVGYVSSMHGDVDGGFGAVALANALLPGDAVVDVVRYALALMRAAAEGGPLPSPPDPRDEPWRSPSVSGEAVPTLPEGWEAYPGHYRANNPWLSNFRIVQRGGRMILAIPGEDEMPLVPMDDGAFREDDERSPERLRFDAIVDGRALRANLSGCDYYRVPAP